MMICLAITCWILWNLFQHNKDRCKTNDELYLYQCQRRCVPKKLLIIIILAIPNKLPILMGSPNYMGGLSVFTIYNSFGYHESYCVSWVLCSVPNTAVSGSISIILHIIGTVRRVNKNILLMQCPVMLTVDSLVITIYKWLSLKQTL